MNVKMIIKQYPWISLILISAVLFVGLVFITRGIAMSHARLPLAVIQKVRNLSAHETEWQIATTAQPGDVLEYFVLVQLPADYADNVRDVRIFPKNDSKISYRPLTLASAAKSINKATEEKTADSIFNNGLEIDTIKPGEFIDLKWQGRLNEAITFDKNQAPLLEEIVTVGAEQFNSKKAKTLITISSTLERQLSESKRAWSPRLFGMNPRQAYDDLGTGAVIAGEDLGGIKELRISGSGKTLAWRLVSNELIEAGIPAGLPAGGQKIEFIDINNKTLADKLSFTILPTEKRATVIKATPSVVSQGKKRVIVLQGIRLKDVKELSAKDGAEFELENINQINDRVLSAEIPANVPKGEYRLFVGQYQQDVKLTVN